MMATIWFLVILLCLVMYVVLDGYDLGAGVASLFERDRVARRDIVELIATGWDGNESWLILLAVALWAGFPLAFGVILPSLYLPLILTLFALILRGFSVEMVSQSPTRRSGWVWVFGISSLVAALSQGIALGELTSAVAIKNGAFSGSAFGSLTGFSILIGVTLTLIYTALGYAFIKLKTEKGLRLRATRRGQWVAILAVVGVVISLIAINGTAAPLNLSTPGRAIAFWALLVFAAAGVAVTVGTFGRETESRFVDHMPFTGLVVTVISVLLAITVARYPLFLPPHLTLAEAQGPRNSMVFLLVGIGLNIPLVLFYNWFAHRAFRGKLQIDAHHTPPVIEPQLVQPIDATGSHK
ncbi:MAG: cytochrome bd ubiquinol oxidase subunit [Microbacteriaceae bacterium]|nr:cytochrome bd ubiquinol oxidase subunit [Microbacteriaceae bacterium]